MMEKYETPLEMEDQTYNNQEESASEEMESSEEE